jgi:hypothetical protein
VLQNALARYLAGWWPSAESAGAGRQGSDVTGTPGIVWECKTASDFKRDFRPLAWARQADGHRRHVQDVPVVVYWPERVGAERPHAAMAILPLPLVVRLLVEAGYAGPRTTYDNEPLKAADDRINRRTPS